MSDIKPTPFIDNDLKRRLYADLFNTDADLLERFFEHAPGLVADFVDEKVRAEFEAGSPIFIGDVDEYKFSIEELGQIEAYLAWFAD